MFQYETLQRAFVLAQTTRSVAAKVSVLHNSYQTSKLSRLRTLILVAGAAGILSPARAFAQTATGNFEEAVKAITQGIQQVSVVAVLLLIVAGFALLMWSGVSESIRIRAVRIIFYTVVGAAGLFLFAEPLANFITDTFKAGA